ncbi:uncharacterized protein LOC131928947 isoform X2 [Physella acuta]|uniref:uncharacterized protein LOC131928947 isoform X2 n=1 Tax=Physella acuta TaxID=109671 RepID=UPI0027DDBE6C|nr:uncharacterized protein LOC131928947 isoform X2 [Physella acuta]
MENSLDNSGEMSHEQDEMPWGDFIANNDNHKDVHTVLAGQQNCHTCSDDIEINGNVEPELNNAYTAELNNAYTAEFDNAYTAELNNAYTAEFDNAYTAKLDNAYMAELNNAYMAEFDNAYTDSVTSATSSTYLIKPTKNNEGSPNTTDVYSDIFTSPADTSEDGSKYMDEMKQLAGENVEEYQSLLPCNQLPNSNMSQKNYNPEIILATVSEYLEKEKSPENVLSVVLCANYVLIPSDPNKLTETCPHSSMVSLTETDTFWLDKRASPMQNLQENSGFLDLSDISKVGRACQHALIYLKDDLTFGSLSSLAYRDSREVSSQIENMKYKMISSERYVRNLIALSVVITLMFIAIGSVRNLQSSLNQEGGVGIVSMAVSFVGYMLGSVVSISLVQTFQPSRCIVVSLFPNLLYIGSNIYPSMWLMAPTSFLQGVSMAVIWNAMSTYITLLSKGQAQRKSSSFEKVSSNFFGVFCLIYQSYHVIGNLISSLVLHSIDTGVPFSNSSDVNNLSFNIFQEKPHEVASVLPVDVSAGLFDFTEKKVQTTTVDSNEIALCGASFCNYYRVGGALLINNETKCILFGTYMGCIVLAIFIAALFLEPLSEHAFTAPQKPLQKMKDQMISLAHFVKDSRFLLLLPLQMYSLMQFGFISADVTMAFITCPLGVHMVGYAMICFGVCGSISSYLSGLLNKHVGRVTLFTTATKFIHSKPAVAIQAYITLLSF